MTKAKDKRLLRVTTSSEAVSGATTTEWKGLTIGEIFSNRIKVFIIFCRACSGSMSSVTFQLDNKQNDVIIYENFAIQEQTLLHSPFIFFHTILKTNRRNRIGFRASFTSAHLCHSARPEICLPVLQALYFLELLWTSRSGRFWQMASWCHFWLTSTARLTCSTCQQWASSSSRIIIPILLGLSTFFKYPLQKIRDTSSSL